MGHEGDAMRDTRQLKRWVAWWGRWRIRWGGMTAGCWLLIAAVAGGDSFATCPPKSEKLYTPNQAAIRAEVAKLSGFESDMRALLADVETLQTDDAENRFWGKVAVWRTIGGEAGRGICTGVSVVNEKLAQATCERAKDVADLINNFKKCGSGETAGCVEAGLSLAKKRIENRQKGLEQDVRNQGGNEPGTLSDPRYQWNEELQTAKNKAATNEMKGMAVEGANKAVTASKGGIDAMNEACKSGAVLSGGGLPHYKDVGRQRLGKVCEIVSNFGTIGEVYKTGGELDAASKENRQRQGKLIAQLESRINTISERISKLSKDVDTVVLNWETMGMPEPIMTPMNGEECEDEVTDDEIQRSLAKMKKPSRLGSLRSASPAEVEADEAEPSFFNAETLGAVLQGTVQALSAIEKKKATREADYCSQPGRCLGFEGNRDVGRYPTDPVPHR